MPLLEHLFHEKASIKSQVLCSFLTIVLASGAVTIGVCLGILYGTANSTIKTAKTTIISNTKSNALINAESIAGAVGQQLQTIADSVCLVGATYSKVLLPTTSYSGSNAIVSQQTFREYEFRTGCVYPACPKDYGPLNGKTRLPPISNFTFGSTLHTSTYLYSSSLCTQYGCGSGARTNKTWNSVVAQDPNINAVINSLAFQDVDLHTLYFEGPNTTVMFYISSKIGSSSSYASVHRTFPGITKANNPTYNPPGRPWFAHAPVNGIYLYGPYKETFTGQLVLTLSSRQMAGGYYKAELIDLVTAAVFLLTDLQKLIEGIVYTDGGFGALIASNTLNVIVWGKTPNYNTFNPDTQTFKTLPEIEPNMASISIKSQGTFEYTDAAGIYWIVACVPFFQTTDNAAPGSSNALIMLVFSRKMNAESPLLSLQKTVGETTASISTSTLIVLGSTIGSVSLLVSLIVAYITRPLDKMRRISADIIRIAAEEEEKKDYSGFVEDAFFNQYRSDEIGGLRSSFFDVVCLLNSKTIQKRNTPKYPTNLFHVDAIPNPLSWENLLAAIKKEPNMQVYSSEHGGAEPTRMDPPSASRHIDSLDVLGRLSARRSAPQFSIIPTSEPANKYKSSNVGTASAAAPINFVNRMTSIKTKFYCISLTLLLLLLLIMLITVINLAKEGATWMTQTSVVIESKQMEYVDSACQAKATFVKAYFQEMSMDVLTAAAYVDAVVSGNFSNIISVGKKQYLKSYSLDPVNTFASSVAQSKNYSGYFAQGDVGCQLTSTCEATHNSTETKITSVIDLKMQSFSFKGSFVSLMQVGFETLGGDFTIEGYVRTWPYSASVDTYSEPSTCLVQATNSQICANKYVSSACSSLNPPAGTVYPPYHPRCRSWYQFALQPGNGVPGVTYFQYPRVTVSGRYVITAVTPIKQGGSASGKLVGVVSFNVLVTALSDSVNALKILRTGYCYLIDSRNTTQIILSPHASKTCSAVSCAEGFTASEYSSFYSDVLMPIQSNALYSSNLPVSTSYKKKGKAWRLSYTSMKYGTVDYTVIATVPRSEVLAAATTIQTQINSNVAGMIAAFVICIAIFTSALGYVSIVLVRAIVDPINKLRDVLGLITVDDLTGRIPDKPSSLDMKILLDAFSNLMVALRFCSDSYARGKKERALTSF